MVAKGSSFPAPWVVALLVAPMLRWATAASGTATTASGGGLLHVSVAKVEDTLRSLLRSLQDTAQSADQLFKPRQQWCEATLRSFDEQSALSRSDLHHLAVDLKEQEAALEEATGTTQQLRAQISMVQHTIALAEYVLNDAQTNTSAVSASSADDRTRAAADRLSQLIEGRRQTLATLGAELDAMAPAQLQLHAQVTEMKRRIEDRAVSTHSTEEFLQAVRDSCSASLQQAESQAAARVAEADSIGRALKALEAASAMRGQPAAAGDAGQAPATAPVPSFIQIRAKDPAFEARLLSDFNGLARLDATSGASTAAAEDPNSIEKREPVEDAVAEPAAHRLSSDSRTRSRSSDEEEQSRSLIVRGPNPGAVLARIEAEDTSAATLRAWCAKARAHKETFLEEARTSVQRSTAEADAHAEAEEEVSSSMKKLESASAALKKAAADTADGIAREVAFLRTGTKDQALATKILKQAITILQKVETEGGGEKSAQQAGFKTATRELSVAKNLFQEQAKASNGFRMDAEAGAKGMATKIDDVSRDLSREHASLQMAWDMHASQLMHSRKGKEGSEAEIAEANEFLQRLAKTCGSTASAAEERQRAAEVRALEDAKRVLVGKRVEPKADARRLRGRAAVDTSKLSPIERAAAEMGVSPDES